MDPAGDQEEAPWLDMLPFDDFAPAGGLGADFLDSATLAAVCSAIPPPAAPPLRRKRTAEDEPDSNGDESDEGAAGGGRKTPGFGDGSSGGPDSKPKTAKQTAAARTKACKEKERREKVNDRCVPMS